MVIASPICWVIVIVKVLGRCRSGQRRVPVVVGYLEEMPSGYGKKIVAHSYIILATLGLLGLNCFCGWSGRGVVPKKGCQL